MSHAGFSNLSAVRFQTRRHHYVYDRFSNEILRVEPVVAAVLDDSFVLSRDQIVAKYRQRFAAASIGAALGEINRIQREKKALLPYSISRFTTGRFGHDRQELTHQLNSRLTQLTFNVTERCNLRCDYCVYSGRYPYRRTHNNTHDISLDLARRAVDFFSARSRRPKARFMSLYGGEPMLRFGFVKKLISHARRCDPEIRIAITTNGTLLDEAAIGFLADHDVALTISLDGPRDLHDSYRRFKNGGGSFSAVMGRLEMLKSRYPDYCREKLKINSVIAPYAGEVEEIERFFKQPFFAFAHQPQKYSSGLVNPQDNDFMASHHYYDYVQRYYAVQLQNYLEAHIGPDRSGRLILARALLDKQVKMLALRSRRRLSEYAFFWPNGICIPGVRCLFVAADGRFFPCEKLYDYNDLAIGHIDSGFDVDRIAESMDQYCANSIDQCRDCWAYRLCGECFLTLYERGGWNRRKRKDFCDGQKNLWVCILALYATIIEQNSAAFDAFLEEQPAEA